MPNYVAKVVAVDRELLRRGKLGELQQIAECCGVSLRLEDGLPPLINSFVRLKGGDLQVKRALVLINALLEEARHHCPSSNHADYVACSRTAVAKLSTTATSTATSSATAAATSLSTATATNMEFVSDVIPIDKQLYEQNWEEIEEVSAITGTEIRSDAALGPFGNHSIVVVGHQSNVTGAVAMIQSLLAIGSTICKERCHADWAMPIGVAVAQEDWWQCNNKSIGALLGGNHGSYSRTWRDEDSATNTPHMWNENQPWTSCSWEQAHAMKSHEAWEAWDHPWGMPLTDVLTGSVVEGIITHSTYKGIFIDIGARKDGFLLHSKETWYLNVGDNVSGLQVTWVDAQKGWIRLNLVSDVQIIPSSEGCSHSSGSAYHSLRSPRRDLIRDGKGDERGLFSALPQDPFTFIPQTPTHNVDFGCYNGYYASARDLTLRVSSLESLKKFKGDERGRRGEGGHSHRSLSSEFRRSSSCSLTISSREIQGMAKVETNCSNVADPCRNEMHSQSVAMAGNLSASETCLSKQNTSASVGTGDHQTFQAAPRKVSIKDGAAETEIAPTKVVRTSILQSSCKGSPAISSWDYPLSREEKKWRLCQLLGREQESLEAENDKLRHTIRRLS